MYDATLSSMSASLLEYSGCVSRGTENLKFICIKCLYYISVKDTRFYVVKFGLNANHIAYTNV